MASNTRKQLEAWLATIRVPAGSRVYDVGGSQLPIKGRTETWEAVEYKIIDLVEPHHTKHKPDIIYDVNVEGEWPYDRYDIAFCIEVMEYVYNPMAAMKNFKKMLKNGGILYLSSHFIYPIHNPANDDMIRYTPNGIRKMLERSGFKIIDQLAREADPEAVMYLKQFIGIEGMRGTGQDEKIIGNLIKAKKI